MTENVVAEQKNLRYRGLLRCKTTHPFYPNYDGRTRCRVNHLFAPRQEKFPFPASLCGQLAVQFIDETYAVRNVCAQCEAILDKMEAQSKNESLVGDVEGPDTHNEGDRS